MSQFPPNGNILQNYGTTSQLVCWYWYSQDTFPSAQGTYMLPFYSHPNFPNTLNPSLASDNYLLILNFYNFIISRTLYKWNQTEFNFGDFFFIQRDPLEIHAGCHEYLFLFD